MFMGGDMATREFVLHEAIGLIPHVSMDRTILDSGKPKQIREAAGYPSLTGGTRLVIAREVEKPLELSILANVLERNPKLKLIVTSPSLKTDTKNDFAQFVIKKGVWVQMKSIYAFDELVKMVQMRHSWDDAVARAIVELSASSPAAVLNNCEMIALFPKPSEKLVKLVLTGGQTDSFEFANLVMLKDKEAAARLSVSPLPAFGALFYKISQCYRFLSYRARGYDEPEAMLALKIPMYFWAQTIQMAHKWSPGELLDFLDLLGDLSVRAKRNTTGVVEYMLASI